MSSCNFPGLQTWKTEKQPYSEKENMKLTNFIGYQTAPLNELECTSELGVTKVTLRLLIGPPALPVPGFLSWGGHVLLPLKVCRFLPREGTTLGAQKRPYLCFSHWHKFPCFSKDLIETRTYTAYLISIISFTCKFTIRELVHLAPGTLHYVWFSGNYCSPPQPTKHVE